LFVSLIWNRGEERDTVLAQASGDTFRYEFLELCLDFGILGDLQKAIKVATL